MTHDDADTHADTTPARAANPIDTPAPDDDAAARDPADRATCLPVATRGAVGF